LRVAAVVVNYRTADLTARAVSALLPELAAVGPAHVIVVDNASGDGSFERLQASARECGWQDRVTVLAAPGNGGYGAGINLAVRHALAGADKPEYVYIINSDAYAEPGTIAKLVSFLDRTPDAGLAGGVVLGTDDATQGAAFRFPTIWSEIEGAAHIGLLTRLLNRYVVPLRTPPETTEAEWISGASMLIRRRVFEEVGLFDEGFFLYFEEVDMCRRAEAAGWRRYFVADAPVRHIGSVSTGMTDEKQPMPAYWFVSRHRYFMKHKGRGYALACDGAWVAAYVAGRAKRAILERSSPERPHMLRDFVRHGLGALIRPGLPSSGPAPDGHSTKDDRPASELGIIELIAEDVATYGGDLAEPGLWAVILHRLGDRAARLEPAPLRQGLGGAYRLAFAAVDWVWGIHLPRTVELGRRVRLWHNGCMFLIARSIGDDVHIRHDTTFGPLRGADPRPEDLPVIEPGVDIGAGACVLGRVRVGAGAVIGANTVVMKDVPPAATVLGVPARIVPT
jgi:GT2 family glycosyltransferase/serine acetyltransferase